MAHGSGVHVGGVAGHRRCRSASRSPAPGRPGGSATGSATRSRATAPTPSGSPTANATGRCRSAALLFAAGYVVVAAVTGALASTAATAPDTSRVVLWSVVLCGLLGAPAIAIGSGRAAIWAASLPASVVAAAAACRQVAQRLGWSSPWWPSSVALVTDFGTALNVISQLHTDTGAHRAAGRRLAAGGPNAVVFSGAYLLGPGFTVGDQHDRLAGRGHGRRAADVPAARRAARHRPDAGLDAWLIGVPPLVAALGVAAGAAPPPDATAGRRAPCTAARGGMLAGARCSASSRCWPAVRSARAG